MSAIIHDIDFVNNNFESDLCHLALPSETAEFLGAASVLRENWTVYDRVFSDGQREICVTKSTLIRQNGPLAMPNRARRGESEKRKENSEDSAKRSKQAVRLRCKAIQADRMITLTFRENIQDRDRVAKYFDAFRRGMSKGRKFHYVATLEKQERGALHMHVAVKGAQSYFHVRSLWQKIVGLDAEGRQMGQIHVRNPNAFGFGQKGTHKLAGYISKYIAKDIDDHELNKKRYWSSKGIVVPEKNYYSLPHGTTASDAFVHVMQLAADHNNDGMTFFANQALGVCWVATAPIS